MVRTLYAVTFVLSAGVVAADDKKDEKKPDVTEYAKLIVGKWEITKAGGNVGPGSTLDFSKDGKLEMVVKDKGRKETIEGKYKLDKDKLTITLTAGGESEDQTLTVKKLTADAMELVDGKGEVDVLKKVKKVD